MTCSKYVSGAISAICPDGFQGFKEVGYIGNFEDIESRTFDTTTGLVSAISLGSNTMFAMYHKHNQPFSGMTVTPVMKSYGMTYDISIPVIIPGLTASNTELIGQLDKGRFFIALEQLGKTDNADSSKYALLGIETGMVMMEGTLEPYGDNGGYSLTLTSNLNKAALMYLFNTDADTTDTLFNTLIGA